MTMSGPTEQQRGHVGPGARLFAKRLVELAVVDRAQLILVFEPARVDGCIDLFGRQSRHRAHLAARLRVVEVQHHVAQIEV